MHVIVGGTFEYLHKGHRLLLKKAFEIGTFVTVGITADGFKKGCKVSFEKRRARVEEYIRQFGKNYEIVEIHDKYGPALEIPSGAIVVSTETLGTAKEINSMRVEKGLEPLKIYQIPMVYAEDLMPISSHRIRDGKIDEEGRRIAPLIVNVGSKNPSKIRAVEKVFKKIFKFEIRVISFEVDSGVPPQPFEDDTIRGAINRAKKALGGGDYGVGIEAGLFWNDVAKEYFDKAFCAVIDSYGNFTYGYSGGFVYPPKVIEMVKSGMEVGVAIEKISGIPDIKKKQGAIGFLSKGLINRTEFNAQAVLMAMIPRISNTLYY